MSANNKTCIGTDFVIPDSWELVVGDRLCIGGDQYWNAIMECFMPIREEDEGRPVAGQLAVIRQKPVGV